MPTPEEIAAAIVENLTKSNRTMWIDPETHSKQHEALETMIEEWKSTTEERIERRERRRRIADKVMGSLILGGILTFLGLIGAGIMTWAKDHLK